MQLPEGHGGLARDALAARHLTRSGCFVSNQPCRELAEIGEATLPAIETVLLEEVLPLYHCHPESLSSKFPGLRSLPVTYFAIAKDAGLDRGAVFFRRLYGSLRVEAMRAVHIVWLVRKPTGAIPEPLMVAISELAREGTGDVQAVARWLLDRAEDFGPPKG
jgi:hypothetical protein